MKLGWYINRLRAMSAEEISARTALTLKKQLWLRRRHWIAPGPNVQVVDSWHLGAVPKNGHSEREALLAEAERYLKGDYRFLNVSFNEAALDWHADPQSGKRAPLEFGLDLDYRDASRVGSVKNIWEKNRHHHLTVLAAAYALTQDERYAHTVTVQLQSWLEENPTLKGINWSSSLELAVRLISWVWIERLLRGSSVHTELFGEQGVMWAAVYWHQWLLEQHYSHGSSANNHLIGEITGLFMAATVWPYFSESARWQTLSRDILEREIVKQTFSSGLNREQAFSYHIFSLEFFLLAGLEGERASEPFSHSYMSTVRNMLEVIPALTDVGHNVPRYGDADEGMALQLRPLDSSRTNWLYCLGNAWLSARVPLPEFKPLASWLIWADEGVQETTPQEVLGSLALEDAGLYLLSSQRGTPQEMFCLADAGPLGYSSLAAHGHADALSFALNVGGVPVIVDPGTYVYHGNPEQRGYFRGTKAHNTVTVDGQDQSVAEGIFLWGKKAKTSALNWAPAPDGGELVAEHDGYTRLEGQPVHRRTLVLRGARLEITDQLLGSGSHGLECRLHFAPWCSLALDDEGCRATWNGSKMSIYLDDRLSWRLAYADQHAGWYSPGFNAIEPTYTLVGTAKTHLPATFDTHLEVLHED